LGVGFIGFLAVQGVCPPHVAPPAAHVAPAKGKSKKSPAKAPRRARAQKGASESRTNKKVEVIAMMKRAKGVTLAEIVPYASHCTSLG